MIKLPDLKKDSKETADLCKCRPVCKSRRRDWKGKVQNTSAELLLERKALPECFRRCPTKVFPNSPCPLFGRSRRVTVNERNVIRAPNVVRVCQAPIADTVDTSYLQFADLAKRLGAWGAVKQGCPFCNCGACSGCRARDYVPHDAERASRRRDDMKEFDRRVRTDCMTMRIMYD